MRWIPTALAILFLASVIDPPSAAQESISVSVMIDFGTGEILWADVNLSEPASAWNATETAASTLGLELNVTYYPDPFVNDIGDMKPIFPDYWHFLFWNESQWDLADTGPAEVAVARGDVFGWFLTRDAPWNFTSPWPGPRPEATPDGPGRHPVQMFRYNLEGTGRAAGAGPMNPSVSWSYDTGAFEITATPAFSRGTLYLSTWTGFVALDERSGSLRWRNSNVAGASSPALFDRQIYVGGRDGRLHVLSADSGMELWNVSLQPNPQFSGITSSPRIAYGRVYVGTFNETGGDGTLAAIDLYTHEPVWTRSVSSIHLSSPAVSHYTLYVGLMGRFAPAELRFDPPFGLLALDSKTGEERWFLPTNGSIAASPAVSGDLIFVTTRTGDVLAVETGGTVRWSRTQELGSIASPAVSGDLLAVGYGVLGTGGAVQTFHFDGSVRQTWSGLNSPVSSSLSIAGGYIYGATNDANGTVYAWALSDLSQGWGLELEPPEYVLSSPVIHDGALYIASDNGFVYRLADRAAAPSSAGPYAWVPLVVGAVAAAGTAVLIVLRRPRRLRRGP